MAKAQKHSVSNGAEAGNKMKSRSVVLKGSQVEVLVGRLGCVHGRTKRKS